MITLDEILRGRATMATLPADVRANVLELHRRINVVRGLYGVPMRVNDGYRRPEDAARYGAKTSEHLRGRAIDIDDTDAGPLWAWCLAHLAEIAAVGLWLEDPRWTHGAGSWMHLQTVPPRSGVRIFRPSSRPATWAGWDGVYDRALDAA